MDERLIPSRDPMITVSGMRGVVGESLLPATVSGYVAAYAASCAEGPIVMSRDGRPSGHALARLIAGTLQLAGRNVLNAGIAATPSVGRLIRQHQAAGAVQITASHNPPEYNGLKLFRSDGRVLTAEEGEHVIERFRRGADPWATHALVGDHEDLADTIQDHLQAILARVDVAAIRARQFSVVLDANAGSGSILALPLLEKLGCRVAAFGQEPTGHFLHPPEPIAKNLQSMGIHVRALHADAGFCQDPDADRLALIDAQGDYLGEEYTLALCVDQILRKTPGPIVTNCSSSRMTEDIARRHGVPFHRTKVGEAHVADGMVTERAVFGGEGNGGPIDPAVGLIRDSFVGMAIILEAMAQRTLSLRALADQLPRYSMAKSQLALPRAQFAGACRRLERHFADAQPSELDGLRLDWPNRWLLVRASNTEPIVRIVAEGITPSEADQLVGEAAAVMAGGP